MYNKGLNKMKMEIIIGNDKKYQITRVIQADMGTEKEVDAKIEELFNPKTKVSWEYLEDCAELKSVRFAFLGQPISELSKEDLLMLIAWLDKYAFYKLIKDNLIDLESKVSK